MAQIKVIQTTFSAGELDPNMIARTDSETYYEGAQKLRNWTMMQTGGLMRRPGTTYLADVTEDARLIGFSYSTGDNYLFALSNTTLRIYNFSGSLLQTITGCPWTTANVFELNWAQYADKMFLVHRDMKPQEIQRTSATTFTRADFMFEGASATNASYTGTGNHQPYYKYVPASVTLDPSATTGTITVVSSVNTFTSDWANKGIIVRHKGKEILLTTYVNATTMNATVRQTLTDADATTDWDEASFSDIRGYPSSVIFHENRLWFGGGTVERPAGLYASQSGSFYNFNVDDASDSDAINVTLAGTQLHEIRHLSSGRHLEIFTDSAEFYVRDSSTEPITPTNISIKHQTPFGVSRVRPVIYDNAVLFVQRGSNTIREFAYSELMTSYEATSVSLLAHHLIGIPKDTAISLGNDDRPESFLFVLNTVGDIAVYHSLRSEKKQGWTLWTTDGEYRSVCAIFENLFVIAKRTVNGVVKYYLEKVADTDAVSLDCAKEVDNGSATTTFSGFTHLASQSVNVISNNYSLGTYTVSSGGVITITESGVSKIMAGFNYTPEVQTMPVDSAEAKGQITGDPKRINRVLVNIREALSVSVDGTSLLIRQVNDDFSTQPTAVSDTKEFHLLGWQKNPTVTITQSDPLPLKLLGLNMEVVF